MIGALVGSIPDTQCRLYVPAHSGHLIALVGVSGACCPAAAVVSFFRNNMRE